MSKSIPEPDPYSRFEDEGIPDLQEGTPEQQERLDPQEAPLPGDRPLGLDEYGTTAEEQYEGEPLVDRLAREVPEEAPEYEQDARRPAGPYEGAGTEPGDLDEEIPEREPPVNAESGLGAGADLDTGYQPDEDVDEPSSPLEPSGLIEEEPRRAGRLVDPDEGSGTDTEDEMVAEEIGPDFGGFTAEEAAMRVERE